MRISCAAYSFREALTKREMSLSDFIRLCAELGLDGVELTGYYFPDTNRATLNALKRECFRHGLAIAGTATRNHFTHPDPEAGLRAYLPHSQKRGLSRLRGD